MCAFVPARVGGARLASARARGHVYRLACATWLRDWQSTCSSELAQVYLVSMMNGGGAVDKSFFRPLCPCRSSNSVDSNATGETKNLPINFGWEFSSLRTICL